MSTLKGSLENPQPKTSLPYSKLHLKMRARLKTRILAGKTRFLWARQAYCVHDTLISRQDMKISRKDTHIRSQDTKISGQDKHISEQRSGFSVRVLGFDLVLRHQDCPERCVQGRR